MPPPPRDASGEPLRRAAGADRPISGPSGWDPGGDVCDSEGLRRGGAAEGASITPPPRNPPCAQSSGRTVSQSASHDSVVQFVQYRVRRTLNVNPPVIPPGFCSKGRSP
eukprot:232010-Prorocentrum_minimum.AAC.1